MNCCDDCGKTYDTCTCLRSTPKDFAFVNDPPDAPEPLDAEQQMIALLETERDELRAQYKSAITREHELELANESLKRDASTWERRYNEQTKLVVKITKERDELHDEVESLSRRVCDECDGSGWQENRVEGRHPCVCMEESEPYSLLASELERLKTSHAIELQCQMEEHNNEIERLKADKVRIETAAHNAVNYVGSANYEERIRAAHSSIDVAIKETK
jgi:hypothetical protein